MTRAVAVMLLAATVTACAPREVPQRAREVASEVVEVASEVFSEVPEPQPDGPTQTGTADGDAPDHRPDRRSDDAGGDGDAAPAPPAPHRTATDDLGRVGANGRAMLASDVATLVVEMDVQEGADPDPGAVEHLMRVLRSVVDKRVVAAGGNVFAADGSVWTPADLRAVAADNRQHLSGGDTVVVYLLYVRGRFQDQTALGVVTNASEAALFPDRWRDSLGTLLGGAHQVERAVLVHEVGHLFGLVNLTYRSDIAREDADHPGHSSNRGSVMFWAIESTAVGQLFSGPPPDDFDDADRADLQALATGRY